MKQDNWFNEDVGPYLTPQELAARHKCSQKSLANRRVKRSGLPFTKIGRLVRYRLRDVLAYELAQTRSSTSDQGGGDVA